MIDESLVPPRRVMSENERRSITRLLKYEAWAWFQAMTYWIPGKSGWILRRLLYRPFFQRAGKGWHIAEFCSIQPPGRFQIGHLASISRFTVINALGGVVLGDHSGIGPFGQIISVNHRFPDPEIPMGLQPHLLEAAPVIIETSVWIAAGCTILPGVRIGKHSVVGAGSVVTKDVPPYSFVAGVPAKLVRDLRRGEGPARSEIAAGM